METIKEILSQPDWNTILKGPGVFDDLGIGEAFKAYHEGVVVPLMERTRELDELKRIMDNDGIVLDGRTYAETLQYVLDHAH